MCEKTSAKSSGKIDYFNDSPIVNSIKNRSDILF